LRARREELEGIADFVIQEAAGRPFIMGGDFNTPPSQALTQTLREHAVDAFARAGRGWGASALNSYPFVRIDQIWSSPNYLTPVSGLTVKTEHSDHRIAVADFD
jgi:endonuclease/exonuclease/phosphatase (EEP) superfamily protein YafD